MHSSMVSTRPTSSLLNTSIDHLLLFRNIRLGQGTRGETPRREARGVPLAARSTAAAAWTSCRLLRPEPFSTPCGKRRASRRFSTLAHALRPFEVALGVGLGRHQGLHAALAEPLLELPADERILVR